MLESREVRYRGKNPPTVTLKMFGYSLSYPLIDTQFSINGQIMAFHDKNAVQIVTNTNRKKVASWASVICFDVLLLSRSGLTYWSEKGLSLQAESK